MNADEIWQELYRLGGERFDHVTLSGGNPALLSRLGTLVDGRTDMELPLPWRPKVHAGRIG